MAATIEQIEAAREKLDRADKAVDAAISVVTDGLMKPHRGWAMACKNLMDRRDQAQDELDALLTPPSPRP
ncbi:hypothetical protein [Taklimakanibacter deserti]|uniref:hypothetical protein n=1 Tax=Taklimakanibacter deserti TaxID=2267839 RepID=UPI000E65D5A7